MPDAFDPYHTWLGIQPSEQPPDYYRLLGLPRFEEKPEAIEHAADLRMAHLRTLATGKHAQWSQKLLNEVAAARVCLLNVEKKAAYDRRLREILQQEPSGVRKDKGESLGKQEESPGVTITYHPKPRAEDPRKGTSAKPASLGQLGEYRLIEKLGQGGMGVVYKAIHTKLRREVAVKVLPEGSLKDDRAVARFEREMAAVGALDHSNVVRAYDAREIEGIRFLVLELVEGMDLSRLLRQSGPMNVADACEVIRQAALGLQSAQEHGLVHRDVKPSNLMLTPQGRVKVLDLGRARFRIEGSSDELTTGGHALGTVDYMAPEQAASTHTVDVRADVYSLGCTLYKLLTGRSPFRTRENQTAFEILTAHVKEPVPSIRKIRPDVPAELDAMIAKMLAKHPKGRFATPAEVADAVGPMTAGADLSGQFARSSDQAVTPVAAGQAMAQTAELSSSTSSPLTKFFRRMKEERSKPVTERPKAAGGLSKKLPIWVGPVVMGVAIAVCVLVWGVVSSRNTPPPDTSAATTAPTVERNRIGTDATSPAGHI